MGAFDGWFGRRSDDPLQDLDPKVREFLKKESPLKVESKKPSQEDNSKAAATNAQQPAAADSQKPAVPAQSQYQDGRYAHLWRSYRPLKELENETKSDQERMADVVEAYKGRQAAIGLAAMENCAEEQFSWNNCMKSGDIRARMTMCSDEVRKYEKCHKMQTKLLKILGYLDDFDKSPEEDERIQLHADKLYHQWLEQDRAIKEARKEGKPVPTFKSVWPQAAAGNGSEMNESAKQKMKDRLDKMDERDREAEKAATAAEIQAKKAVADVAQAMYKDNEAQRQQRRQKGEETLWDRAVAAFRPSGSDGKGSDGKES